MWYDLINNAIILLASLSLGFFLFKKKLIDKSCDKKDFGPILRFIKNSAFLNPTILVDVQAR